MTALRMNGRLSKLSINGSKYIKDAASGQMVLHVSTSHALIQAAGYLKYVAGQENKSIYFRGQAKLYNALIPSLFRGISSQSAQTNRISALKLAITEILSKNALLRSFGAYAHEPLLQHYGLKSSWIDLVDNVWVALWFACHNAHSSGFLGEYLHFERRDPTKNSKTSLPPYVYILLVAADNTALDGRTPGLYKGSNTELIDLRVACPSLFLRPHAQHGVLFRMRGGENRRPIDYHSQVCERDSD